MAMFNEKGKLILSRQGDFVQVIGNQFVLDDPLFTTQSSRKPFEIFAYLVVSLEDYNGFAEGVFPISAHLSQRYYTLESDWNYSGSTGTISISRNKQGQLEGSFTLKMHSSNIYYYLYYPYGYHCPDTGKRENPLWGEKITISGKVLLEE